MPSNLSKEERIMSEAFDSIKQGLKEAIAFAEGNKMGARVYSPSEIDVKALRLKIGMTQDEFATACGKTLIIQ